MRVYREMAGPRLPLFVYFRLPPANAYWKDGIEKLVKQMKGVTFQLRRAEDLAAAIRELEERLARRREGA
ncbi:MAG TPA: hypothetical protein DEH78_21230 [Solibacterales bacterium]|nr:hypothetical protein [Bryobacterales bacterium]